MRCKYFDVEFRPNLYDGVKRPRKIFYFILFFRKSPRDFLKSVYTPNPGAVVDFFQNSACTSSWQLRAPKGIVILSIHCPEILGFLGVQFTHKGVILSSYV
jgi:hypothetical protein